MERAPNAWWEFVKQHKGDVRHIKDRKEKFQVLAEMWKNEKASLIYVSTEYVTGLHATISKLKQEKAEMAAENMRLKEALAFLSPSYHGI